MGKFKLHGGMNNPDELLNQRHLYIFAALYISITLNLTSLYNWRADALLPRQSLSFPVLELSQAHFYEILNAYLGKQD